MEYCLLGKKRKKPQYLCMEITSIKALKSTEEEDEQSIKVGCESRNSSKTETSVKRLSMSDTVEGKLFSPMFV